MFKYLKSFWFIALLSIAIVSVGLGMALAQDGEDDIIYAAYNIQSGHLRLISGPEEAKSNEEVISWNKEGPQGPQGAQGECSCDVTQEDYDHLISIITDLQARIVALEGQPSPCPNDCSGHGVCFDGVCECEAGWTGEDCSVPSGEPCTPEEIEALWQCIDAGNSYEYCLEIVSPGCRQSVLNLVMCGIQHGCISIQDPQIEEALHCLYVHCHDLFVDVFGEPQDLDEDGFNELEDCDDSNPDIYPGATEVCNDIDDNCNDLIDEGLVCDCEEDLYEDNDSSGTATSLEPPAVFSQSELTSLSGDDDWFVFEADEYYTIFIEVNYLSEYGDINIYLYDDSLDEPVSASESEADVDFIEYTIWGDEGGQYYLQVTMNSLDPAACNPYSLGVEVLENVVCTDDGYEENDSSGAATSLDPLPVTLPDLVSAAGDDDWFIFYADEGQTIYVDVSFSNADGDINIYLYDDSLIEPVSASESATDGEFIEYVVSYSGFYYLKVLMNSLDPEACNPYSLGVSFCEDDIYEDNDSYEGATPLDTPTLLTELISVTDDNDWFSFYADVGQTIFVDVDFAHAEGDIDIYLYYDPTQLPVSSSISITDDEFIEYIVPGEEGGLYYLDVFMNSSYACNPYSLQVSFCEDDAWENNDSSEEALSLELLPVIFNDLVSASFDPDWFSFYAYEGETIYVDVGFAHADGDINIYLYDSDIGLVSASESTEDYELIEYVIPEGEGGQYFLEVWMNNPDACNPYGLGVSVCADDIYENNDEYTDATPLGPLPVTLLDLVSASGDDDWFVFEAGEGQTIFVDVLFSDADGDIDIYLYYDPDQSSVSSSISMTDDEFIDYVVPEGGGGQYYLLVFMCDYVACNPYSLDVNVE